MLLRSEAYIKLAYGATEVLRCSATRAEAAGLGVALDVKASESEVAGCLIWHSLEFQARTAGILDVVLSKAWHKYCMALDSGFVAARVKHWHQSGGG